MTIPSDLLFWEDWARNLSSEAEQCAEPGRVGALIGYLLM